jgi:hypothetical protein
MIALSCPVEGYAIDRFARASILQTDRLHI